MPLLIPNDEENKEEFIERFITDEGMIEEFPDADQRMAIAVSQWEANVEDISETLNVSIAEDTVLKDSEEPQWILCFPFGQFYIEKYDTIMELSEDFYSQVIDSFNSDSLSKPFVDKDHDFKESYGDILELKMVLDINDPELDKNIFKEKGLYTLIKFNKKGVEVIKEHEYSYISPAWGKVIDVKGVTFPNKLMAISLVNFPAFEGELPMLREQLSFVAKKMNIKEYNIYKLKKETIMDLSKITEIFELSKEEATSEAIYDKIVELKKISVEATEKVEELTTSLTLSKENEDKLIQENLEMGKVLAEIETAKLDAEADTFILSAVEKGKIHPTQVELMTELYKSDKDKIVKLLSLVPEVEEDVQKSHTGVETELKVELSDAEMKKLKMLGIDTSDAEEMSAIIKAKGE